jgi:hypothetical protein
MIHRLFSVLEVAGVLGLLLLLTGVGVAGEGDLDQYLPGWSVARFLPSQGRMVLEHAGEMHVVRGGEEIPGLPGTRLRTIGPGGALIEIDSENLSVDDPRDRSKSWLLLKSGKDGKPEIIVIYSMPEEGLPPDLSAQTQEILVSKTSSGSVLKHVPVADGGNDR